MFTNTLRITVLSLVGYAYVRGIKEEMAKPAEKRDTLEIAVCGALASLCAIGIFNSVK